MSISVLMAVYRSEKAEYLQRALTSVWDDQSLTPDEIVLVQDGPVGDELSAVIAEWQQKLGDKLNLVVNESNIGLTKSLNKGIACIASDFIARMDSDDVSHPLRFERQVAYLEQHDDVDIVGGALQEFDDENECLNVRHYPLTNDEVLRYIYKASPLAHPTVMMRRRLFDTGLRYDERYRTSQDIALWYDALCAGHKIGNVEEITINFRRADDVFKRRSREKAFNEYKIYVNGIRRLYGAVTWRYIYPLARLAFRLMPVSVVKRIYGSRLRKSVLEKSSK